MARPKGDLGSLVVPKDEPPPAAPLPAAANAEPPPAAAMSPAGKAYAHTLSLRLTADQYRRLRRYVHAQEEQGHGRATHQGIIEAALAEYLDKRGG